MELQNDIACFGTLCTRDVINNRPYYLVTYEQDGRGKTKWIAKNVSREFISERGYKLVKAAKTIEAEHPECEAIKMEFTIDDNGKVSILSWEPIERINSMAKTMTDKEFADTKSFAKCGYLDTNHILSDGAYWNTVDQLGSNPRPLDYSLFRELIALDVWNSALADMGYTSVDGELTQKIGNKPYTSVNYTFEALTPSGIPEPFRFKLFDYYERMLKKDKTLHNSLEKDLIFNIYDFGTEDRLAGLLEDGFTSEEVDIVRKGVLSITKNMLTGYYKMYEEDRESINELGLIRCRLRECNPWEEDNVMKLYKYINEMLEAISRCGTPQYARQTRCTFMAKRMCETLVDKGYYSRKDMDDFIGSISTESKKLKNDLKRYTVGTMTKEEFNSLYGELRSGIFDIRVDSFEKLNIQPGEYFTGLNQAPCEEEDKVFMLDTNVLKRALDEIGFDITPEKFLEYIVLCYKNKDKFKFEITKSLNLLLEIINHMGEVLGIAREDMSYLEICELLSYHSRDSYIQTIESRRSMYHANTYLLLPDIIFGVGDIDMVELDRRINIESYI